MLVKEEEKRK